MMGRFGTRFSAMVALTALLSACATHSEPRPSVEVQYYSLDWSRADVPRIRLGSLEAQAIVLTPAQWPLESSVKRLLSGDFIGVVEAASLRFRSSVVPEGVFEDLYAYGLVAAYVRVSNPTGQFLAFDPMQLVLRDKYDVTSPAAPRESLPRGFSRVDWDQSAKQGGDAAGEVALALVVIVAVVAADVALGGRGNVNEAQFIGDNVLRGPSRAVQSAEPPPPRYSAETQPPPIDPVDPGVLGAGRLSPHSAREGVVFFVREPLTDWSTAVLAAK